MAQVKQYVNLPGATGVVGPTISFRVYANQVPNVHPGDRVDWWIEANPANMDLKYQSTAERTQLAHGPLPGVTSGTNHYFDNTLTLTQIGGDKYVVKASRDGQRANFKPSDEYETWRKLYYSVWWSHPESLAMFNGVEARWQDAFKRGFLELERKATQATLTPAYEARLDYRSLGRQFTGAGAHDWPFMNGGPGALMNLRNGGGNPAGATLSDKPLHMALLVVPDLYWTQLERMTFDPTTTVAGSTPTYNRIFPDPQLGGQWLWTAQASWSGAGATDVRGYFTYTVGWPTQINWDLRPLAGLTPYLAGAPGRNFRLDFAYIYRPPIGGFSWGNFSVAACTNMPENQVLQALTHEMGHAAGQAVQQEPLYNVGTGAALGTFETNRNWYNDPYGGSGPHCHINAILTPDPTTSSRQIYIWGGGAQMCPMFYMLNNNSDPDHFCAFCLPRIKRRDLRTPTGAAGTWNDFG